MEFTRNSIAEAFKSFERDVFHFCRQKYNIICLEDTHFAKDTADQVQSEPNFSSEFHLEQPRRKQFL